MKRALLTIILTLASLCGMRATEAYLVTCSPGSETYEQYGHTAVRVKVDTQDYVFNYGVFSFHKRFFLWRWLLGETDYSVEILPYPVFLDFYGREGRTITEQRLNLREREVLSLAASMMNDVEAARHAGWTYRYNFFYDNCTTRAIDAINEALGDSARIEWPQAEEQTLRQILHQFATPWLAEGQDYLIGTEVDEPATLRQQLFSPIWASHYAGQATIIRADGSRTPLVSGPAATLPDTNAKNPLEMPVCIVGLLILAAAIISHFKGWSLWQVRMVVHVLQGVVGMLVAFLFAFSAHPAVDSNWLIVAFNPLWLVAAWYVWRHRGKVPGRAGWCYIGSIVLALILMLIGKIAGQNYPLTAVLPYIYLLLSQPRHDKAQ